jgi:choline dehydrogenase-like flavoprotein
MTSPDVVIIGSGMGGASLAAGLAPSGARVVILERGRPIPEDAPARDPNRIFRNSAFRSDETWIDADGKRFEPGNYYHVGGNSKLYGAVLIRYRAEDFAEMQHAEGVSPAWPFPYETLAPWYDAAERLYEVRGDGTEDPTEPPRSAPYPHPPVPDEPAVAAVRERLRKVGTRPFSLPLGVDVDRWLAGGRTAWDGYPDTRCGKMDAETCGLRAALAHENVTLVTDARVTRLEAAPDGRRVAAVVYEKDGAEISLAPGLVALCAGAVQSAALLLASGLGNRSDQVGRCFMNHNATALIAIDPRFRNDSVYQKTFGLNDWYLSDGAGGPPLGNMQLLGRVVPTSSGPTLPACRSPRPAGSPPTPSTSTPSPRTSRPRKPRHPARPRHPSRLAPLQHGRPPPAGGEDQGDLPRRGLPRRAFAPLRRPRALSPVRHRAHRVRPDDLALDPDGRSWDLRNLYVCDAACLPTSAAVNPALTVAAMALRAGAAISREFGA